MAPTTTQIRLITAILAIQSLINFLLIAHISLLTTAAQ